MNFLSLFFFLMTIVLPAFCAETATSCDEDIELMYTGYCPVDGCIACDVEKAVCTTLNPKEVVPQNLDPRITYLELTYTGPDIELTPEMFDRYLSLTIITIKGNIASVAPKTFGKQWNLTELAIFDSKLESLPSELLSDSRSLTHLNLVNNKIKVIPTNIFPQMPNLTTLFLNKNDLLGCLNHTISPAFTKLHRLSELRLGKYGTSVEYCQKINGDYLLPIQHIRYLDLSESLLFYGNQGILKPRTNLEKLAMNNVTPYRECPALAEELFHNMPESLNNLTFRYWTSTNRVNDSCVISEKQLAGLKKLRNLQVFDCSYGDKLFGNVLRSSIFDGFANLHNILLNWCGISFTEDGVFNGAPDLFFVDLTGNLLGPRNLNLYTYKVPSRLVVLHLVNAGINTQTYLASNLLQAFPNLIVLSFDNNFFETIPNFGTVGSNLVVLTLRNNKITNFSADEGKSLCETLHLLTTLVMAENELVDVSGFRACPFLTQILLGNNMIGTNLHQNMEAIGKVSELIVLDLTNNKIKYIVPEFFADLTQLEKLVLADNEIYSLANGMFDKNPFIMCLDLGKNDLTAFNHTIVSNGLSMMRSLYLQSNQIVTLAPELLQHFDTKLTRLKIVNLMKNPLSCACDNYLSNWVRQSPVVIQPKKLTCNTPTNYDITTSVVGYEPDYFYCRVRIPLIISGIALACVLLSLLCALPGYKYRWYLRHPQIVARAVAEKLKEVEFEEKCQYDAFISYNTRSDSDSQWLVDKLIPAIEEENANEAAPKKKQKLYVVDRDSAIGSAKYSEKCRAIEASRKAIILLSKSYLTNPSCLSEADLVAGYEFVNGEHCYQPNRILVLVLEEMNEEAIKSPIASLLTQNVIHIAGVDGDEVRMKRIWKRVRRFLTKTNFVYRKKKKKSTVTQREPTETDPLIQ